MSLLPVLVPFVVGKSLQDPTLFHRTINRLQRLRPLLCRQTLRRTLSYPRLFSVQGIPELPHAIPFHNTRYASIICVPCHLIQIESFIFGLFFTKRDLSIWYIKAHIAIYLVEISSLHLTWSSYLCSIFPFSLSLSFCIDTIHLQQQSDIDYDTTLSTLYDRLAYTSMPLSLIYLSSILLTINWYDSWVLRTFCSLHVLRYLLYLRDGVLSISYLYYIASGLYFWQTTAFPCFCKPFDIWIETYFTWCLSRLL